MSSHFFDHSNCFRTFAPAPCNKYYEPLANMFGVLEFDSKVEIACVSGGKSVWVVTTVLTRSRWDMSHIHIATSQSHYKKNLYFFLFSNSTWQVCTDLLWLNVVSLKYNNLIWFYTLTTDNTQTDGIIEVQPQSSKKHVCLHWIFASVVITVPMYVTILIA